MLDRMRPGEQPVLRRAVCASSAAGSRKTAANARRHVRAESANVGLIRVLYDRYRCTLNSCPLGLLLCVASPDVLSAYDWILAEEQKRKQVQRLEILKRQS